MITQEQADAALGKIIREAIAKALPLQFSQAYRRYITIDLVGFGDVLIMVEICGTQTETKQ